MTITREHTLIYAAGFFDGEGCIYIGRRAKSGREYFTLTISVSNTDKASVEIFRKLFGGYLSELKSDRGGKRKSVLYMWQVDSGKAAVALDELLPFLRLKKKEAKLAVRFQSRRGRSSIEADSQDWLTMKQLKVNRKVATAAS